MALPLIFAGLLGLPEQALGCVPGWLLKINLPNFPLCELLPLCIVDISDNSNSSCDSCQPYQSSPGYHGNSEAHQQGGIPVHRNESISISDMKKYATDVEVIKSCMHIMKLF